MLHLVLRNGTFYGRYWVPLDLRHVLGTAELKKSLRTKVRHEARTAYSQFALETERLFFQLRVGMLTHEQIIEVVAKYRNETLNSLSSARRVHGVEVYLPNRVREHFAGKSAEETIKAVVEFHTNRQQGLAAKVQSNNFGSVYGVADSLIEFENLPIEKDSPEYRLLCEHILKADISVSGTVVDRMNGKFTSQLDKVPEVRTRQELPAPSPIQSRKLSELWEEYRKNKLDGKKWKQSAQAKNHKAYRDIIEIVGDLQLNAYTEDNAYAVIKNLQTKKRPLSVASINYTIEMISSMWNWGQDPNRAKNWGLDANPWANKQLTDNREDNEKKDPYESKDIVGLFNSLANNNYVKPRKAPEKFWIPLICLYTGMRSNEVCQLRTEDVTVIDGIPIFNIKHSSHRLQSTKASKSRICPVHPVLIHLGLTAYVDEQTVNKHDRLFNNLNYYIPPKDNQDQEGKWNKAVGKWYNRTLEPKFTDNPLHTLHSTRTTFINWFFQNMNMGYTEVSLLKDMIGHLEKDEAQLLAKFTGVTQKTYKSSYSIKLIFDLISNLNYNIDISTLEQSSPWYAGK